jgi:hypothetical protein
LRVTVEHDVRIVESLAAVGVPDEAIDVTGIQIATGSGKILTSQDVRITLEIAATPAQLAEVLGILSAPHVRHRPRWHTANSPGHGRTHPGARPASLSGGGPELPVLVHGRPRHLPYVPAVGRGLRAREPVGRGLREARRGGADLRAAFRSRPALVRRHPCEGAGSAAHRARRRWRDASARRVLGGGRRFHRPDERRPGGR